MNNAIATRNLYRFEEIYFLDHSVCKQRTLREIKSAAKRVWQKRRGKMPKIYFGLGTKYNGRYLSYQQGDEIHLAEGQRDYLTLTHELVHAMGYDYHDKKFVDVYFDLLEKIFHMHRGELELAAGLYGVDR